MTTEHPLPSKFTFYYISRGQYCGPSDYEAAIQPVARFETVEGFWKLYQYLKRPSELQSSNYHLFRGDIPPMWEHDANKNGEQIILTVHQLLVSRCWEDLLLAFVGGELDAHYPNEINGISANVRGDLCRMFVWCRSSENEDRRRGLCRLLMQTMPLAPSCRFSFKTSEVAISTDVRFKSLPSFTAEQLQAQEAP